ncbi:MAG: sugar phosphate isomerase/epimerase [Paenibacillaceae bacterium]|nr:sugar phosphate isomerase/epimerase [Paenibacillaceae bacterium]
MKLAFTTLGCPQWDMETIVAKAAEYGYDGIDMRGLQEQMNVYEAHPFAAGLKETRDRLQAAGLALSCFSSSIKLAAQVKDEDLREELERYAELCGTFGTRYIRVFGGGLFGRERAEALAVARERLAWMEPIARQANVRLMVETHDDWIRCEDMLALVDSTSPDAVGVLWDVHHPNRMLGELPEHTWTTLGDRIGYTHWKDSLPTGEGKETHRYTLMGEGDIPLAQIAGVLRQGGYDGWCTLEWEKRWFPDIAEPEVAFPQYVQYMRQLLAER